MSQLSRDIRHFRTDQDIRRDVRDELHFDPSVTDPDAVDISVHDGVVTLRGMTDSLAQRWAIGRAVQRVRGVRAMADELDVTHTEPTRRDDTDIEDTANRVLQWDARAPRGVVANVREGWLTLRGAVASSAERDAAYDTVRHLIGLRGISNEITVAPSAAGPNLRQALADAVRRRTAGDDVHIEIDGNTVVLSGTVSSYAELEELEQTAAMARGVIEVQNRLHVAR